MSGARPPDVVIAGAGIGGLTAALALADIGCAVHLLERAPVLSEAGAGVQLSPNATRVLAQFGVLAKVRAAATVPQMVRIRRARDGRVLGELPMGAEAERRWGAPNLVVHRAALQRILIEELARRPGITLSTGIEVAGFVAGADKVAIGGKGGGARMSFEAELLVGADGLRSAVRRQLHQQPSDAPVYSGRTAWRAMIPAARLPAQSREPATNLWLGKHAHVVHYPLGDGVVNAVAIIQTPQQASDAALDWNVAGDPTILARRLAAWCPEARDLVAAADDWRTWPLFERPALPHWSAGRVTLLGDAAHPMMPFLAQGAAQAIEDAAAIACAVVQAGGSNVAALRTYERARLDRATRVQRASARQGEIYHLGGPMAAARDVVMRTLGPSRLMARYDWLYGAPPAHRQTTRAP